MGDQKSDPNARKFTQAISHVLHWIFSSFGKIVGFCSGEWLLTTFHIPNGGAIVSARALLSSLFIYATALAIHNAIDPTKSWTFSREALQSQIVATLPWFGTILAVSYAALYSKFSSQWTYLAELYNQIKEAECGEPCSKAMADWKAGFIEDADELHLLCKRSFCLAVWLWGKEDNVADAFDKGSAEGGDRLKAILKRAKKSIDQRRF